MNKESPKNPILNAGVLVTSAGMITSAVFDGARVIGGVIAIIGFIMFFVGYRNGKASGAVPDNERGREHVGDVREDR